MKKQKIVYVTTNQHKIEENGVFQSIMDLDGTPVADLFEFEIRNQKIDERLEVDLAKLVTIEAKHAYERVRVPCIVEHAGLVFDEYASRGYPGGLTKPMWNTLGEQFVRETNSVGRRASAVAVVGYCDGQTVHVFLGATPGRLEATPRGARAFYWDTVFAPDTTDVALAGKTFAEISADHGLERKVRISQSSKAMIDYLRFRRKASPPPMWR